MSKVCFNNKVALKGYYNFYKRINGVDVPLFSGVSTPNLIVDAFLNTYRSLVNSAANPSNTAGDSTTTLFRRCSVGTGTAEPSVNDTGLVSVLATVSGANQQVTNNLIQEVIEGVNYLKWTNSKTFSFPIGGVVGNISEVGVFGSTLTSVNSDILFSRTLIKDEQGNNTTITLTAEDQLIVTYTLITVVPCDFTFNFTYDSVDYLVECALHTVSSHSDRPFAAGSATVDWDSTSAVRPLWRSTDFTFLTNRINSSAGTGWSTFPSGLSPTFVTPLNTANVRKRRIRLPTLAAVNANGIKGLRSTGGNSSGITLKFTPAFPKTANDILEIEFATDFVRL